jgi:hypothetical protein
MMLFLLVDLKSFTFYLFIEMNLLKGLTKLHDFNPGPVCAFFCVIYFYSCFAIFLVSIARPDAPAVSIKATPPPPSPYFFCLFFVSYLSIGKLNTWAQK